MVYEQSFSNLQSQDLNTTCNISTPKLSTSILRKEKIGELKIDSSTHPIYKGLNVIGRDPRCHIPLVNMTVSKKHAEIDADDTENVFISDLGSSNGTILNNRKLLKPNKCYQLVSGNTLTFGEIRAIFDVNKKDSSLLCTQQNQSNDNILSKSLLVNSSKNSQSGTLTKPGTTNSDVNSSLPKSFQTIIQSQSIELTEKEAIFSPSADQNNSQNNSEDCIEKNMRNLFGESCVDESIFNSSRMLTQNLESVLQCTQVEPEITPVNNKKLSNLKLDDQLQRLSVASTNSDSYYLNLRSKSQKKNIINDADEKISVNEQEKAVFEKDVQIQSSYSHSKISGNNEKIDNSNEIISDSDDGSDDLIAKLPKFSIDNTLSNPASPKSCKSEKSDSSVDLTSTKMTPKSMKFRSVLESLKSHKLYKPIDEDSDDMEKVEKRVLRTKSAYDNVKQPFMDDKKKSVTKKVIPEESKKPGRAKKANAKAPAASNSPRMNPLAIEKITPIDSKIKTLKIILTPMEKKSKRKIINNDEKNDSENAAKTKEPLPKSKANKSKSKEESSESQPAIKTSVRLKKKKVTEEASDKVLDQMPRGRSQARKLKVDEKKEENDEEKERAASPVLSQRTLRKRSLDETLNHSISCSINKKSKMSVEASISSPRKTKYKILFTGVDADKWKNNLRKLGVSLANDITTCTVLLTDKVRRTVKFLCALTRGIPIVSIKWLEDSSKSNQCLEWDDYILKDSEAEKKFDFKLKESLNMARNKKLFDGLTILVTPQIQIPPVDDLKEIIKTGGGTVYTSVPKRCPKTAVIVTTKDDSENAKIFIKKMPKNTPVLSTEFILTGILKQQIDSKGHALQL